LILKPCPIWIDDDCSLGFAYIAVSQNFDKVKWLIAVFMIEKLICNALDKMDTDNKITDVLEKRWPEYFM
jgi:hypothetical protein